MQKSDARELRERNITAYYYIHKLPISKHTPQQLYILPHKTTNKTKMQRKGASNEHSVLIDCRTS